MRVAILDDYQNVTLQLAGWSGVRRHAEIGVFSDHAGRPLKANAASQLTSRVTLLIRQRGFGS
jgi:hypothetical protein